jgi:glycosyltransferase involved in cell wall biosynthesis
MSGGARVISIYARELERRGHDVRIVVALGLQPTLREHVRRLRRGQLRHVRPTRQPSHYDSIDHLVHRLDRLGPIRPTDCPDADVIVATWWETAEWMAAMPASKGRHVHFVQGYEAFEHMPKDRVDAVLRSPNRKITISHWLDDLLRNEFGNRDVHHVPNGVDMRQFNAPPRDRSASPVVGMLYHEASIKNSQDGIDAFVGLKAEMPDAKLIAFGNVAPSDAVPLPAGTSYNRSPPQDAIKNIYAACDVWLCSSTRECFHFPPLEAMACRCPVISTPVGGPLDIVKQGENGFLVPMKDVPAMTGALIDFFAMDAAAWRQMSDQAYETALGCDWGHAADSFEIALCSA